LIAANEVVAWTIPQLAQWTTKTPAAPQVLLAGDAWDAYAVDMRYPPEWHRILLAQRPQAVHVARLAYLAWLRGEARAPEMAAPLYVRDKIAFTTRERTQGQGGNPKAASARIPQPMRLEDLAEVVALESQVQAFPWTYGNFADALQAGYGAWVLRQQGRLAAFCVLMFAPDEAHLLVLGVAPAMQRQGLGSVLLQWCQQAAHDHGLPRMLLELRQSNTAALGFYAQHGFSRIGVRSGYYPTTTNQREDALVMQKTFASLGLTV
jgi:tRNA threonylcarbamoyladenosine biosynthesis protein TsaB